MSKLLGIGMRVRFARTGEEGIIKELLDDDMYNVLLPEHNMMIPAFAEDLMRIEDFWADAYKKGSGAQFIQTPPPKTPTPRPIVDYGQQFVAFKSTGLLVAFEAVPNKGSIPERYYIFLLNDTAYDLALTFDLYVNDRLVVEADEFLTSNTYHQVGELRYDDLNDAPEIDITSSRVTTEGRAKAHERTIKIKATNFFKNEKTAPLIGRTAHVLMLIDKPEKDPVEPKSTESLAEYARRNVRRQNKPQTTKYQIHSVTEFAQFEDEIDLHIEKLTSEHNKLTNTQIIQLQLRQFEHFLQNAIRIGRDPIFVIHGIGKGVLRDEIAKRLRNNPYVAEFKNEYHHKYGWGATEITFR